MASIRVLPSDVSNAVRSYSIFPNIVSIVEELVFNSLDANSYKIEIGISKETKKIIVKDYG